VGSRAPAGHAWSIARARPRPMTTLLTFYHPHLVPLCPQAGVAVPSVATVTPATTFGALLDMLVRKQAGRGSLVGRMLHGALCSGTWTTVCSPYSRLAARAPHGLSACSPHLTLRHPICFALPGCPQVPPRLRGGWRGQAHLHREPGAAEAAAAEVGRLVLECACSRSALLLRQPMGVRQWHRRAAPSGYEVTLCRPLPMRADHPDRHPAQGQRLSAACRRSSCPPVGRRPNSLQLLPQTPATARAASCKTPVQPNTPGSGSATTHSGAAAR